jgi:prepilin-type N-terminal cleavage/methylation domain-containing protein
LGPRLTCRRRLHGRGQEGFTLVELLVTVVLVSVVGVAILMIFSSLSRAFDSQVVRIQNQDDARTAVNQMARYLRMATSSADNMTSQSDAIASALPQSLEFYCDLDSDSVADKVTYYLEETTLRMMTVSPTWVTGSNPHYEYPAYTTDGIVIQDAVRNGTQAVFTYYKYSGGTIVAFTPVSAADRALIVTVSMNVTVNERPELARGNVVLSSDVQIRQRYEGGLQ